MKIKKNKQKKLGRSKVFPGYNPTAIIKKLAKKIATTFLLFKEKNLKKKK